MQSATMWLGIAGGMLMTVLMAKVQWGLVGWARRRAEAGLGRGQRFRGAGVPELVVSPWWHHTVLPSPTRVQNAKGAIVVGILFVTFISWVSPPSALLCHLRWQRGALSAASAQQGCTCKTCTCRHLSEPPPPPPSLLQIPSHGNAARYIERSNGCTPDGIVSGTNETCIYTPEMRRWDYFKASFS